MKTLHTDFSGPGRSQAAFTLIELLVVIGIIGVIAAMTLSGVGVAKVKKQESATIAMKAQLELAIEGYKKQFGTYPPDNAAYAVNNPQWNPLAYELGGMRRSGANFIAAADPNHTVTPVMLASYFSLTGFLNDGGNGGLKSFLNLKESGPSGNYALLTNSAPGLPPAAMVLQVPADHPAGGINVWRYRAYPATGHNPKSYDLWAEIKRRDGSTNIIGNWK